MRLGPGLLKMAGLDEIRTQAREEWTGTHMQPKFTPMSGQLGVIRELVCSHRIFRTSRLKTGLSKVEVQDCPVGPGQRDRGHL